MRRRVALYCQHSTGIGHLVRSSLIVRALAVRHEVTFIVGGRPFEGSHLEEGASEGFETVRLPPLERRGERLVPSEAGRPLEEVLVARSAALRETLARARPDVLLVEHFPFSRWSLREEILGAIAVVREGNPGARVICSLRDIARKSTFDTWEAGAAEAALRMECGGGPAPLDPSLDRRYGAEVTPVLNGSFDALLVHGDPRVTTLEEQISWAGEIRVPVTYTGYVSASGGRASELASGPAAGRAPEVLVSSGGGGEGIDLALSCIEAWRLLLARSLVGERRMVIFRGPFMSEASVAEIAGRASGLPVTIEPFTSDLSRRMRDCDVSVSRAGYNTCVNVLEARPRAVLVPSAVMADQLFRARRLEEIGIALAVTGRGDDLPSRLADAIVEAGARPRPDHDIALDGADRTRDLVEAPATALLPC